jgi:hypothetical protein
MNHAAEAKPQYLIEIKKLFFACYGGADNTLHSPRHGWASHAPI